MKYVLTHNISPAWVKAGKGIQEGRREANLLAGRKDAAHYQDKTGLDPDEVANWAGAVAELAWADIWGVMTTHEFVVWPDENGHIESPKGDLIVNGQVHEIRHIRDITNPLTIRYKDRESKAKNILAYVHEDKAGVPTGRVDFLGWIDADPGWRLADGYDKRRRGWPVSQYNLKQMFLFPHLHTVRAL